MRRSRSRLALSCILAAAVAGVPVACSGGGATAPRGFGPAPVTVASVEHKAIPVELHAIGDVEASSAVEVRAQVGGVLETVHFERGQAVRKGDPLLDIDPRPYGAALAEAEAVLARDRVLLKNAKQEVDRYAELVKKDYVTREQYDQIEANAAALESTIKADEAAVESARLQLGYCSIRSPIAGRAGDVLLHAGNVVKANSDNPLVVLLQTQPILVSFSVPEGNLDAIRRRAAEGAIQVEAHPTSGGADASRGTLTFIDNTVDKATGTILLKATFVNRDDALWPGEFVDVVLVLSTQSDAVVVPSQAVQRGQQGTFVFVVKEDSTVESRPVDVDREFGPDSVIASGLTPGETVVTEGQLRLVPGSKVEIKGAS
jgi:multidrug efflux system membrane fusion protein